MSGICGSVSCDGGQPDSRDLEAVLEPLKRRGPDGTHVWIGDGVALGHASLATTPEALIETLPLSHTASGCTITADARLDNRAELTAELGLGNAARRLGDGELILLGYLKWGEDCVHHLVGDFAFAIWDTGRAELFCARDPMGMRQLVYFHRPGATFVFATEPAAVLQHSSVPKELNPGRIADFLDNLEGCDLTETFYADVSRLPPAHTLTLTNQGVRLRKYWQIQVPAQLLFKSDDEYVEAFLEVFRTAVHCRLRSASRVGAMLSGGMDSSSVVAIAAELLTEEGAGPLPTFSAVGPDTAGCAETSAIHTAIQMAGIEPHLISCADLDCYADELVQLTKEQAEPFDGPMGLLRGVYLAAHRKGMKVVLDGVAGDLVLDSDSHIERLLRRGRLVRAWRSAVNDRPIWGPGSSAWKVFGMGVARAWVPRSLRAVRRRLLWWGSDRRIGQEGLIAKDFARGAKVIDRRQRQRERDSSFDLLDAKERARRIEHAYLVVGRERYDRVASSVAIEPRDPFLDLRLVDFCLSLPGEQIRSDGWRKILLRRAMAGKLPHEIRWRRSKEHLGPAFTSQIFARLAGADLPMERMRETIGPYVDLGRIEGVPAPEHCKDWVDALCLYHWLNLAGARPEVKRMNLDRNRS